MPRDDRSSATAPANGIYRYAVRDRNEATASSSAQPSNSPYVVGDIVWVKPRSGRCDAHYDNGTVTRLISDQAVEVNGVTRHVRDIRRRISRPDSLANSRSNGDYGGDGGGRAAEWNEKPGSLIFATITEPPPPISEHSVTGIHEIGGRIAADTNPSVVSDEEPRARPRPQANARTQRPDSEPPPEDLREEAGPARTPPTTTDIAVCKERESSDELRVRRSSRIRRGPSRFSE
uniref:Uncharacterized protein n=1 Tax=Trichuris muris TaxID=70415 RepID=A0A5S6Q7S7_TRIMR